MILFFDSVKLLHYKCHKISFKHGGSYIDSSETFQYATTAALNHEEIKINNCNWNRIKYPSKIDDWKRLRKTI